MWFLFFFFLALEFFIEISVVVSVALLCFSILCFLALTSCPASALAFLLLLEATVSFFSHFDSLLIPSRFGARALKSLFLSLLVFKPIIYSGTGQPELAITVAIERNRGRSASVKKVTALPLLPALPVSPILCM